jgi:hypothetical protein
MRSAVRSVVTGPILTRRAGEPSSPRSLCLTQDPDADGLLSRGPLALLIGMLLDQQIPTHGK